MIQWFQWIDKSTCQWISESLNQGNQWINDSPMQLLNEALIIESMKKWLYDSVNEAMEHRVSESMNPWTNNSQNQWTSESMKQSFDYSIDCKIRNSINQWVNDSVNQRINESMISNEPIVKSLIQRFNECTFPISSVFEHLGCKSKSRSGLVRFFQPHPRKGSGHQVVGKRNSPNSRVKTLLGANPCFFWFCGSSAVQLDLGNALSSICASKLQHMLTMTIGHDIEVCYLSFPWLYYITQQVNGDLTVVKTLAFTGSSQAPCWILHGKYIRDPPKDGIHYSAKTLPGRYFILMALYAPMPQGSWQKNMWPIKV